MSIKLMTKVWEESPYEGTKLLIHLAMADTAHDDGTFFASQKLLSQKSRCTVEYVRQTIRDMEKKKLLSVIKRGSSRGLATVYQMLWNHQQLPKSEEILDPPTELGTVIQLPKSDGQPPKSDGELPNFDLHHPSYTSILPIHPILSPTNEIEIQISVAEKSARAWWEYQNPKPIGKNAWHSLLAVCKASEQQGYTFEQIIGALNYIGTVPSMRQMDLVLRGIGVKKQTSATTIASQAMQVAKQLSERGQ